MKKVNMMHRISLSGGIIGMLTTNPRAAIDKALEKYNNEGWRCHQIMEHSTVNLFVKIIQLSCLIVTFGLWTFGAGYMLLLEKEIPED